MNSKLVVLLCVLGTSYAEPNCQKPTWWYGKNWYGTSKQWCPTQDIPIWNHLILNARAADLTTVVPGRSYTGPIKAGDSAVVWSKVHCPVNKDPSAVIGTCAATGQFVYDVPAPCPSATAMNDSGLHHSATARSGSGSSQQDNCDDQKDAGLVNYIIICSITSPCGDYGVGTITGVGQASGPAGTLPGEGAITGGTGAYAALGAKGGSFKNYRSKALGISMNIYFIQ